MPNQLLTILLSFSEWSCGVVTDSPDRKPELEYDLGPAIYPKPWFTHWENGDTNTALPTSKCYCDDQIVIVDAEALCKSWETVHRQGMMIKIIGNDGNIGDEGQGDDKKEWKEDKLGNTKDYSFLV